MFQAYLGKCLLHMESRYERLVGKLRKIKNNLPELETCQMCLESHLSILLVVVVVGFWWFDARWCWFMVLLLAVHRCNLVCVDT